MKRLDVQGYECFVLSGMKKRLGKTERIQFEVDDQLLNRFATGNACFGSRLVRTLQEADFDVSTESGAPIGDLTSKSYYHLKRVKFPTQDMYAVKRNLIAAA
jgi:hypothetical protein